MADDVIFEFIHSEMVSYVISQNEVIVEKEEDLSKLEYMGFSVGYKIVERLTKEYPRFSNDLDTVKFICTDFWTAIYKKPMDNLRTNHHGVFVLQENCFKLLTKISNSKQHLELAPRYIAFTCGLIRGALANLNINCLVTAEVQTMPACKFNIQVQQS